MRCTFIWKIILENDKDIILTINDHNDFLFIHIFFLIYFFDKLLLEFTREKKIVTNDILI